MSDRPAYGSEPLGLGLALGALAAGLAHNLGGSLLALLAFGLTFWWVQSHG
jgi:hypothetical protein